MRRTAALIALVVVVVACSGQPQPVDPSPSGSPSPSPSSSPSPPSAASPGVPSASPSASPTPEPAPTSPAATDAEPSPTPEPEPAPVRLRYEQAGSGFTAPLQVLPGPGGRTLVVEQDGRIRDLADKAVFVDLRGRVTFGGERGLLGATFSADGARLYVHYTDDSGDTAVAICPVSGGTATCPAPALEIDQPRGNHNGGSILWGPDGNIWLALGDGGGSGNPFGHAEDTSTPLGAILRLDPDTLDAAPGNPGFGDDRIVHYGLRNPFRMAFGPNALYVGDVGQSSWEEITVVAADARGRHFGWSQWEGNHEFDCPCTRASNMEFPQVEYPNPGGGRAVIAGEVYAGSVIPELAGHFFYSDAYSGFLRSFRWNGTAAVDQQDWTEQVGSQPVHGFGHDAVGELYVTAGDKVLRVVRG